VGPTFSAGRLINAAWLNPRLSELVAAVELALRLQIPIATRDEPLQAAAQTAGVGLVLDFGCA